MIKIETPTTLDDFAKDWKIFMDTCSLVEPNIDKFWDKIIPSLRRYHNAIIVPWRVYQELQKHERESTDSDLVRRSKLALQKIAQLHREKLVDIRGETTDNFADNVFQVVITKFRLSYKILLITQDNKLARSITNLNKDQSCKAYPVFVKRINNGNLDSFSWNTAGYSVRTVHTPVKKPVQKFRLCNKVTSVSEAPLKVSQIPNTNDTVYSDNGPIRLTQNFGNGGEGIVYKTNTPYLAKIFKQGKCTRRKYEKIKLLLSRELKCPGICFPVAMLRNAQNEFVGYLMPEAKGKDIGECVFNPVAIREAFPNWKKKDTVQLCLTILQKIQYLHTRNIIVGDINPGNIKVNTPTDVYFVDTDSFQVEEFPCPVGIGAFTAPEIQQTHYPDFLRTFGNEYFSVATLLFMIMMLGKQPYCVKGGGNPVSNIINMEFPYPFDSNYSTKVPDGPWIYIWSHLTFKVKEGFYQTFQKNEPHASESTRLTTSQWIALFSNYHKLLKNGTLGGQDAMSEELIPTRYKQITGNRTCNKCGRTFHVSDKDINNAENIADILHTCPSCRNGGGWSSPKRPENKPHKNKPVTPPQPKPVAKPKVINVTPSKPTPPPQKSGGCFITTAVCTYMGKPDNCEELTALRAFRDNWLAQQPGGKELIKQYYRIAPSIVKVLDALGPQQARNMYLQLWNEYINPCLNYIRCGDFVTCKELYSTMVRMLQKNIL